MVNTRTPQNDPLIPDRYNSATAFLSSSRIICSPVIITCIIIITVQTDTGLIPEPHRMILLYQTGTTQLQPFLTHQGTSVLQ